MQGPCDAEAKNTPHNSEYSNKHRPASRRPIVKYSDIIFQLSVSNIDIMFPSPQDPIIIGVGEIRQKKFTLENTLEPAELILSAIRHAAKDTTVDVINHVDSISVVPPWSWTYDDLPKHLAQKLGVHPSHLELSSHGGHTPALLCDAAAARVAAGETKLAVVTGGEALASCKLM